jgi:uncharacterized protein YbjT (DUF2867 family)
MRVAIVGGTGMLGRQVAQELRAATRCASSAAGARSTGST